MISLNDRLILEMYQKKELRADVSGGFARMAHKVGLAKLKVLVDAKLSDGTIVPKGSFAFVKEEHLHLNSSAGRNGGAPISSFTNEEVSEDPFIILELNRIEMLDIKKSETINYLELITVTNGTTQGDSLSGTVEIK